jgi:hypothetical protein
MWRAWIGFNFSHSLGVLMAAGLALWTGLRFNTLPVGIIIPALTLIGCVYLVLALLYWFRVPAIGVALALAASPPHGFCHYADSRRLWQSFRSSFGKAVKPSGHDVQVL